MANRLLPIVLLGLLTVVGCQVQPGTSAVVDSLPAPSFSGPRMMDEIAMPATASYAAPRAVLAPQPQGPVAQAHTSMRGIPASWIPFAHPNTWNWIVIHHSATPTGGAAAFDKMHRAKGWDELGYHFVIGNGTDTRDGQIEVGSRWPKQKWGAHTKTPDNQFNEHGIGICLVGNFDVTHPTEQQLRSLTKLVSYLMRTYHISPEHVVGHRDCKSTDCPGRYVNLARIRQSCIQMLTAAGDSIPQEKHRAILASGEMLHENKITSTR